MAGVAGAALDPGIVLILGVANLLADGFSMGMSNYLSRRSDLAYRETTGGTSGDTKPPSRTATVTFLAFVVAGWTPLFPVRPLFGFSTLATAIAFFLVGASRTFVTHDGWLRNGLEMLIVGMLAAGVAYGVGTLLSGIA